MKNGRMVLFALGAVLLIALTEMGRTAVNRSWDYREMTAAKSLHQLSQETRAGAVETERGPVLLLGAGLFAAALVIFGMFVFASGAGRSFGRRRRRKRSTRRSPAAQPGEMPAMPAVRVAPRAPYLPTLPEYTEGSHEDDGR